MQDGWLVIGRWRGVPLRVHWSTPLGALFFSGFRFAPGFWLGFVLLILLHEIGHAWVVKRAKARVIRIDVMPIGGLCMWDGPVTRVQRACIAWGGVWAQSLALAIAWLALALYDPPTQMAADFAGVFTRTNLWIIGFNLLPFPPLDGAEAWKLVPLLRDRATRRIREWRYTKAPIDTRRALDKADELKPTKDIEKLVDDLIDSAKK